MHPVGIDDLTIASVELIVKMRGGAASRVPGTAQDPALLDRLAGSNGYLREV